MPLTSQASAAALPAHRPRLRRGQSRINTVFIITLVLGAAVCFVITGQEIFTSTNQYILITAYAVQFGLAILIISTRLVSTRYALAEVPKDYVPIQSYHVPSHMHEKITGELSRALAVDIPPRLDQSQLMGWGKPGTDTELVYFKQGIAMSHVVLEGAAVLRKPEMQRDDFHSVREYVEMLAVEFALPRTHAEIFVDYYERSLFSPDEFSEDEYNTFVRSFSALMTAIAQSVPSPSSTAASSSS